MRFWVHLGWPRRSQNGAQNPPKNRWKLDPFPEAVPGPPSNPKSSQNLRKTLIFDGFAGWLQGPFWDVFLESQTASTIHRNSSKFLVGCSQQNGRPQGPENRRKMDRISGQIYDRFLVQFRLLFGGPCGTVSGPVSEIRKRGRKRSEKRRGRRQGRKPQELAQRKYRQLGKLSIGPGMDQYFLILCPSPYSSKSRGYGRASRIKGSSEPSGIIVEG